MYILIYLIALLHILVWPNIWAARTVDTNLNSHDMQRLQKVFKDGLTSHDLQSIYFASLNAEPSDIVERSKICQELLGLHQTSKILEFEKDFYLIGAAKKLKCSEKIPEAILSKIYNAIKVPLASTQEAYYRIATLKYLGVQIDEVTLKKVIKNLQELIKKDDSLISLGYAFNLAPELGPSAAFIAERIEDAIVQADEVDSKMLQFEGGLSITSLVINGAFKAAQAFNKSSPVNAEQSTKLAYYFLSRRSVQTAKGAHVLIESLQTLVKSSTKIAPICIKLMGNGQLQFENPQLTIAITDILGKPLQNVALQSVYGKITLKNEKNNKALIIDKVQFTSKSSDKTVFTANLSEYKLERALYTIDVNVDATYRQELKFKVLGKVKVQHLELGIAESDATSTMKKLTLHYPNTLTDMLTADNTQKILLRTTLVEDTSSSKPITVHQAFIRFYNKVDNMEVIYVAEQDANKIYKFDMDIGSKAASDFKYKSGKYELYLIVGDFSLSNSFEWHLANIELKLPQNPKGVTKKQPIRSILPEIKHQFRKPEKRPPRLVSDIFTGLCVTPLVLLFIVWHKLDINISNISMCFSTIGFHGGFASTLILFSVFWLQLNIFQTLRLLIPLAIFTFICGNRLLRRLYYQRVGKQSMFTNPQSVS